ncbi:hypothetical protein [Staphylococcus nepalensis]|uniref:hypothetical protein n=1 Tax=Staphylococcus nepalensis TaxID=214473 RepID=UPI001C3EE5DE|nr:hypothetical protein [Staphylococcus nepalensis]
MKDTLLRKYPYKIEYAKETQGSYEFGIAEQIKNIGVQMDKLDGTNKFSNLLSDLEDE